ncbi:hypothetical protein EYF80_027553 [Liparis tanakae]|uniref:Uncharacterized protein n=1 Tax=Liparis tanakae TaxID=230148 RepID=A0A4Z2HAZ0_9TELE|nr:hypothetical protein EYF80_027553 [Liparis tanakae]
MLHSIREQTWRNEASVLLYLRQAFCPKAGTVELSVISTNAAAARSFSGGITCFTRSPPADATRRPRRHRVGLTSPKLRSKATELLRTEQVSGVSAASSPALVDLASRFSTADSAPPLASGEGRVRQL